MFKPSSWPRIFGCSPGADFPKALVEGLRARQSKTAPEDMAKVELFVNTRRMQRRIFHLFDDGPACILPKIRLVTDIANDPTVANIPLAVSYLRRRLELSQLISGLIDKEPAIAPRSSLFDLADSLALLLAEMHDEAVSPQRLIDLEVSDQSGHWQRSQQFLQIVTRFFGPNTKEAPDLEARQRLVVEALIESWAKIAPSNPIIIAGSTGSRGTTNLFMQAVARLPQGAVILPGFDFDLPADVWKSLDDSLTGEDHPQFRMGGVLKSAGIEASDVRQWHADVGPASPARNRLVSLALRPAPVTNQWLTEGPTLKNIDHAVQNLALVEAPSERVEAVVIAMALREAAENGKTAALVTPNKMLTRRVRAALDRWRIEPDISAGEPLGQTAPGTLLRHVAALFGAKLTAEALLILLKHPLVNAGKDTRGNHLKWTRELELKFRKEGPPFPAVQDILDWAKQEQNSELRNKWAVWITETFFAHDVVGAQNISQHFEHHLAVTNDLVSGPESQGTDVVWQGAAGEEAKRIMDELGREAHFGGVHSPREYLALVQGVLNRGEVRNPVRPHPNIMIWGTLEARVQGAELVIMGGLNDGVWPERATPDPWLNRAMRNETGLLLPERRIGLSAHDFQQAIGAKEVILTRSLRDDQAQTVPSRWLSRLTNLMNGMSEEGKAAAKLVRKKGQSWLDLASALETPTPTDPAPRPSPMPPVSTRPNSLSVTSISKLVRDPYAIYARHILKLRSVPPLRQEPDAPLRGTIVHSIVEKFVSEYRPDFALQANRDVLGNIADYILECQAPWPLTRILWRAKFERIIDSFLQGEAERWKLGRPYGLEVSGALTLPKIGFKLTAQADRIDRTPEGEYLIYDYKTGSLPTKKDREFYDKQLLLEALMAEGGAFLDLGPRPTIGVGYIGLGSATAVRNELVNPEDIQSVREGLIALVSSYQSKMQGYPSRRAMTKVTYGGDYDHLARYGEWDETQRPVNLKVGK